MSLGADEYASDAAFYVPMLVICFFSVCISFLVVIVILKDSKHRISIDLHIVNLAVCDILQAGAVLPLHFKNILASKIEFPGGMYVCMYVCKLSMFLPLMTVMASISTMVAIAIDRYQTIVKNRRLQSQRAIWIIAGIWVFSVLVSSPQLYEYHTYYTPKENGTVFIKECGSHGIVKNFQTIYAVFILVIAYAIPMTLLLFCYACIVTYIWKTSLNLRKQQQIRQSVKPNELSNPISKKKIGVLKMLITIAVVFILLWTPYFVTFALEEINGEDDSEGYGGWLNIVDKTMMTLSTISNPTIYFIFSQDFRQSIAHIICRCKKLNNVVYPIYT